MLDGHRNNFEAKIAKELREQENGEKRMDKNRGKQKRRPLYLNQQALVAAANPPQKPLNSNSNGYRKRR